MGYHWGPTGSCGFELATGIRTLTAASDLDLVIEAPSMIPLPAAISLLASLEAQATVRLDVQLNTPAGGVTLKEYNRGGSVLVKTSAAPVIKPFLSLWE
jgi:phosphoribosyl-dephospho-CoA transferase